MTQERGSQGSHGLLAIILVCCYIFARTYICYCLVQMVIQYAYIVLYLAAAPMSPLLGAIIGVSQIRINAHKLLYIYKRPRESHGASGVGFWCIPRQCLHLQSQHSHIIFELASFII